MAALGTILVAIGLLICAIAAVTKDEDAFVLGGVLMILGILAILL